jgi:hypothetical protein
MKRASASTTPLAARRLLLALLLAAVNATAAAQNQEPREEAAAFEVATVKLNRSASRGRVDFGQDTIAITGVTVVEIIQAVYAIQPFQLVRIDSPVLGQRVDIVAKAPAPASPAVLQRMLQPLFGGTFRAYRPQGNARYGLPDSHGRGE